VGGGLLEFADYHTDETMVVRVPVSASITDTDRGDLLVVLQ